MSLSQTLAAEKLAELIAMKGRHTLAAGLSERRAGPYVCVMARAWTPVEGAHTSTNDPTCIISDDLPISSLLTNQIGHYGASLTGAMELVARAAYSDSSVEISYLD